MDFVISSSYGNDSMAMILWAAGKGLQNVTVAYCDTGWASPEWPKRVEACEKIVASLGFRAVRLKSVGMEALVRKKKGFPGNAQQFCTTYLKGAPFLEWIEDADPLGVAVVMVGKRRAESLKRRNTPEFVVDSEYHGGRTLWHPLFLHSDEERDAILAFYGIEKLGHRSKECNPCVNANRGDFLRLTPGEIERVNDVEVEVGKPMFRPKRFGALGIHGVVTWAKEGRNRGSVEEEEEENESGCDGHYGCGL